MLKPFYNKKKNIDNRLLPSVTAADAGKLVGVTDEGKYALTEGGGGGGDSMLIVHYSDDGGSFVCDKSFSDIYTTITAGKLVIGVYDNGLSGFIGIDSETTVSFIGYSIENDTTMGVTVINHTPFGITMKYYNVAMVLTE